jgi:hypothetical protein
MELIDFAPEFDNQAEHLNRANNHSGKAIGHFADVMYLHTLDNVITFTVCNNEMHVISGIGKTNALFVKYPDISSDMN